MGKPSAENKAIARSVAAAFGGKPAVHQYWDDDHVNSVAILAAAGRPQTGVTSYSTIGLSDTPLMQSGVEFGTRVELLGACASSETKFPNSLATAAFCVINSGWFVAPGIIFPDALSMYEASTTMRHFLFVPPFLWDDGPKTLHLTNKIVAWLLAVPISDAEMRFAEEQGPATLEDLFVQEQIDIYDLHRKSVV